VKKEGAKYKRRAQSIKGGRKALRPYEN